MQYRTLNRGKSSTLNHDEFRVLNMKRLADRLTHIYAERPDLEGERGQIGFVKASGASKSVVNQWLDGKIKSMRLDYALSIEAALGYNHIWLVLGVGDKIARPVVSELRLSDQAIAVAKAFDQLPDAEKAFIQKGLGILPQVNDDEIIRKHGLG